MTESGEAAALVGAVDVAAEIYPLLEPFAGRHVTAGRAVSSEGSTCRSLGVLDATLGRLDRAVAHLDMALEHNAALGAEGLLVRTRAQLAGLLGCDVRLRSG